MCDGSDAQALFVPLEREDERVASRVGAPVGGKRLVRNTGPLRLVPLQVQILKIIDENARRGSLKVRLENSLKFRPGEEML